MNEIIGHHLIQTKDGYIVELFLDNEGYEFAREFWRFEKGEEKPLKTESLEQNAQNYIKEKFPNLKIKAAHIILGSMLIALIPLGHANGSGQPPPAATASQGTAAVYTVKPGDTLYQISERYHVSIYQLQSANGLIDDGIEAGQALAIPKTVTDPTGVLALVNKNNDLPKEYVPADLAVPDAPFSFSQDDEKKLMRRDAAIALAEMFAGAKNEGIELYAVSGYRSYARQMTIFSAKADKRGFKAASRFCAVPGQSEHQTGLAMDLTAPSVNYILSQDFGNTEEGRWLRDKAWRYGFIIRYPKDKEEITGYQYEPWHVRYVGRDVAKAITERGITLEEYLGAGQ